MNKTILNEESALHQTDHRPWPLPRSPWIWRQRWTDLAFLHWPVPAAVLRPHIPRALELELRGGSAWLGVVPFALSDFSVRRLPGVPWLSSFLEMNLRTYVTDGSKPGVWFFRMDASRAVAVLGARATLGLPYVWSQMAMKRPAPVRYDVSRRGAQFSASYFPTGPVFSAERGSPEHFFTERYCLYSFHAGRLLRVEIHHAPWPLQEGAAEIAKNTIAEATGLPRLQGAPITHFSARQDVVGWLPTVVG